MATERIPVVVVIQSSDGTIEDEWDLKFNPGAPLDSDTLRSALAEALRGAGASIDEFDLIYGGTFAAPRFIMKRKRASSFIEVDGRKR